MLGERPQTDPNTSEHNLKECLEGFKGIIDEDVSVAMWRRSTQAYSEKQRIQQKLKCVSFITQDVSICKSE
jgi:hypothetical protein